MNTLRIANVLEWIALEEDEIRQLSRFDGPGIDAKESRRVTRGRLERLHRREAGIDQIPYLFMQALAR